MCTENTAYEAAKLQTRNILDDPTLSHSQTVFALAAVANKLVDWFDKTPADYFKLYDKGIICDLGEGPAPYSPRYILPDYEKFMKNGSEFLRLTPPEDLYDALTKLLILYNHVPSVTHFPVFIGRLDVLLEPFVKKTNRDEAKKLIKGFLLQLDRTITDSFCHGNIGPQASETADIILDCLAELQDSIPNLTLRYDPEVTPDDFATKCIATSLKCANPAFALDSFYKEQIGERYGIASCYNGLYVGGGAYTLPRMRLSLVAKECSTSDEFFDTVLPQCVDTMLKFMDAKIRYLREDAQFFKTNFLVKEGLIQKDRFVGLFGIVGLNECVDTLMDLDKNPARYGKDSAANDLGVRVMELIEAMVNSHENKYCEVNKNRFLLHAQVGAQNDEGTSPGARIAIGKELPLYDHLRQAGMFHHFFPSGVGDIFPFDETGNRNPAAILDVFKGAFKVGVKYLSTYEGGGDLIRVTGYLVKRSDLEKLQNGGVVYNGVVALSREACEERGVLERKVRSV